MSRAASATLTDAQMSLALTPLIPNTLENITTYSATLTEILEFLPTFLPLPVPPSNADLAEIKGVLLRFRCVKEQMQATRTAINSIKEHFVGNWVDEMVQKLEEGWASIVQKRDEAERALQDWNLEDLKDVFLDEDEEWDEVEGGGE